MMTTDTETITAWLTDISKKVDKLDNKINRAMYLIIGLTAILISANPITINYLIDIFKYL